MMSFSTKALEYAISAHQGQKRRYTGLPYYKHPLAVANILKAYVEAPTQAMLDAALLHDVVEDTEYTLEDIKDSFGDDVEELVMWLTGTSRPEDGNRAARKKIDRDRLAAAPAEAQTIKIADLIDNSTSIIENDPKFAKVFVKETVQLLEVLTKADDNLRRVLDRVVKQHYKFG